MSATVHHHFVTVEHDVDDHGETRSSTLTFECKATQADPCRNYPACDCDYWDDEHNKLHPAVPQPECWLKTWFDVGYDATPYDADPEGEYVDSLHDVPAGSGPITYDYDEGIYWHWVNGPDDPTAPPQTEQLDLDGEATR
ncbi:MAG: hypothetical protein HGA44_18430 [Cellulomonadaceae bacterium]|nr:hypothetical protein [Cellulomonadaceae bacterium]